ncbi:uncharacterized protein LACBIDRAFT_331475 [Laccaria bicolor S238N-H82]|uniref:Predicted protein n=1 Tax=Laccaria bicolor (strain S238N-H82 / ATCC MYA-4686) TaxID=486041 RepID=B0DPK8_LACBS|nr:uncharacterized protein LACBIDRAFT_331475 [Laccaria bicolor S238N-H82]EDR03391.1 predicted protein [Laccaria bicolor S238N-H82]|eukprot:XP_001885847.1 predicted protein [Laccaria bicolor S238N-H82]
MTFEWQRLLHLVPSFDTSLQQFALEVYEVKDAIRVKKMQLPMAKVPFIKQEAFKKAHEIRMKADEEFAIEKDKLEKQEQQAIDAQYEKKRKASEVAQKMSQHCAQSYGKQD